MKITLPQPNFVLPQIIDIQKNFPEIQKDEFHYRTPFREGGPEGNDSALIAVTTIHNNKPCFSYYSMNPSEYFSMIDRKLLSKHIAGLKKRMENDLINSLIKQK